MQLNYANTHKNDARGFGQEQSVPVAIQQSAKLFHLLTKSAYSQPVKSMVRELISNALDEAPYATAPLVVTLPTALSPVFILRDYGRGMSHEFMLTRAMSVGDSTKDGVGPADGGVGYDSLQAIGGFGLGMKTPFLISDQFTITVYRDTYAQTYVIDKHNGLPRVLTDESMKRALTKPERGTEIRVAFDAKRAFEVNDALQQILQYVDPALYTLQGASVTIDPPSWERERPGFKINAVNEESFILLGPVKYPINWEALTGVKQQPRGYGAAPFDPNMPRQRVVLAFPAGALEVTLNREQLEYTDRTVAAIKAAFKVVTDDLRREFEASIKDAKTPWEAFTAYATAKGAMAGLCPNDPVWRGWKIPTRITLPSVRVWSVYDLRTLKHVKSHDSLDFEASSGYRRSAPDNVLFVVDDIPQGEHKRITARLKILADKMGQDISDTRQHIALIDGWSGVLGMPVTRLSTVAPPAIVRVPKDNSQKGKFTAYSHGRYGGSKTEADTEKGGLFVPYMGAKLEAAYDQANADWLRTQWFSQLGTVYGLPERFRKQCDMSKFRDAVTVAKATALGAHGAAKKAIAWTRSVDDLNSHWIDLLLKTPVDSMGKTNTASRLFNAFCDDMRANRDTSVGRAELSAFIELENEGLIPKTDAALPDLDKRARAILKAHDVFGLLFRRYPDLPNNERALILKALAI